MNKPNFNFPHPSLHHTNMTEFTDPIDVLEQKFDQAARIWSDMIINDKKVTAFTGAGISTNAGIPDYKGEKGLYSKRINLLQMGSSEFDLQFKKPTVAHFILANLIDLGWLNFIATSNHDGLHQKAGVRGGSRIADVFGNCFVEECMKCRTQYYRSGLSQDLGRKCDSMDSNLECNGNLKKTGTRFGAQTPQEPLSRAENAATRSGLGITLGSSLSVSPFCNLPLLCDNIITINRQITPYDEYDGDNCICIHDDVDHALTSILGKMNSILISMSQSQSHRLESKSLKLFTGTQASYYEIPCKLYVRVSLPSTSTWAEGCPPKIESMELRAMNSGNQVNDIPPQVEMDVQSISMDISGSGNSNLDASASTEAAEVHIAVSVLLELSSKYGAGESESKQTVDFNFVVDISDSGADAETNMVNLGTSGNYEHEMERDVVFKVNCV